MNKDNETPRQLETFVLHNYAPEAPVPMYIEGPDANWKIQKTRRKSWRRLSNAPKAVRKRMGFRERRG